MSGDNWGYPENKFIQEGNKEQDTLNTASALAAARTKLRNKTKRNTRVIGPYTRQPFMAGDPAGPGGVKVTCDELADDVLAKFGTGTGSVRVREEDGSPDIDPVEILTVPNDSLTVGPGAGEATLDFNNFDIREVVLLFSETVAPGTAINIQTGVYVGAGSPATLKNDIDVTLTTTGAAFQDDGRIEVDLNGQELDKGNGSGNGVAEWVSTTQIKLSLKLKKQSMLRVRAPFPTA